MSTTDATYTPLKQLTTKGGGNPIETLNVLEPVIANPEVGWFDWLDPRKNQSILDRAYANQGGKK